MSPELPHHKVFVRIGRSKIHGVGVIAIRAIPKGAHVFHGDDAPLIWIPKKNIRGLPSAIRKLYTDFCIYRAGVFGCPDNFNHMTPAWYLNHSRAPNVVVDSDYRFHASRRIKAGEELTVDYSTYQDDFDGTF